jgi:hypothetical protein
LIERISFKEFIKSKTEVSKSYVPLCEILSDFEGHRHLFKDSKLSPIFTAKSGGCLVPVLHNSVERRLSGYIIGTLTERPARRGVRDVSE